MSWEEVIPAVKGTLPGGAPLRRTEPSGACGRGVAFLGVYPAATKVRPLRVGDELLNLPFEVEAESFAPGSASGREFEAHSHAPLGLGRPDVVVTDLLPYYLANTTASGKDGRSMADNVRRFEEVTGATTGIEPRPAPGALVRAAAALPANVERLTACFARARARLLFTLGLESAAFARKISFEDADAARDTLLYAEPVALNVLGADVRVVHLVHPHLFIKKNEKWMKRHEAWCSTRGRALVGA